MSDRLRDAFGFLSYAVGANMGYRRRVFDEIGGFDEAFLLERMIDFAWRADMRASASGFVPEAVVHYRLKSRAMDAMRQAYVFVRGDAQLYAQHCVLGNVLVARRPSSNSAWRGT